MRTCFRVLVVALVTLTYTGAAPAQTTLRYKFKEGQKLDYVTDQDQKMTMSVAGQDIEMKVNMIMEMTWLTEKVDEQGNAHVKTTISRVKMTMDGPMGKTESDSKEPKEANDPVGKIFDQMVQAISGMEMTFTTDATGEVKDGKVSGEALKKLKNLPGADMLGDLLSPETMKSMVNSNLVLPKGPIEKGKSWGQKMNQNMPFGKLTGETKYTYEGEIERRGQKLEKIASLPDIKIEPKADAPIQIKLKGGKGKGYVLFDNAKGRIAESTNETTMQMEIEVGGMTIMQNIVQTTTMRLKGKGKPSEKSSER